MWRVYPLTPTTVAMDVSYAIFGEAAEYAKWLTENGYGAGIEKVPHCDDVDLDDPIDAQSGEEWLVIVEYPGLGEMPCASCATREEAVAESNRIGGNLPHRVMQIL